MMLMSMMASKRGLPEGHRRRLHACPSQPMTLRRASRAGWSGQTSRSLPKSMPSSASLATRRQRGRLERPARRTHLALDAAVDADLFDGSLILPLCIIGGFDASVKLRRWTTFSAESDLPVPCSLCWTQRRMRSRQRTPPLMKVNWHQQPRAILPCHMRTRLCHMKTCQTMTAMSLLWKSQRRREGQRRPCATPADPGSRKGVRARLACNAQRQHLA
mmetsp:Transcript_63002/g.119845  ORF Transcript_63002/g.119845 Transcript_63002/m.119845 type:complete len:217 (+) Transcript_63002:141-791(+)